MHTFAEKPKATQATKPSKSSSVGRVHVGQSHDPNSILQLQSTIGNQAVLRLLQSNAEESNALLTGIALPQLGHDFARIPVSAPKAGALQTKLAINKPGDEYEQEADRVAEQVMRKSERRLQPPCPCGGQCPKCKTDQVHPPYELLQTKRVQASDVGQAAVPPAVHESLQSPCQPLDPGTRAFMEPRFGHDFSTVRLHTNGLAAESARAVGALAYTVGTHIVLDEHALPDRSYTRHKVLAHELTHVVQQLGMHPDGELEVNDDPGLEGQAEYTASQIMRGRAAMASPSQAAGLMLFPRSATESVTPQAMTPNEIRQEIDEIDRYLQISVLSTETVDHLNEMRRQLVLEQQRRAGNVAPAQPAAPANTPPFYGMQAAGNAFRGIQMYYTVASIPHTDRVVHTFNRGPYLIALNEILQPDGTSQIGFYIAYRRADTLIIGDTGWNEFIIGPDSIELFLSNLSTYVGVAAPVYMFGPPAPYQAYSGQVTQRLLEGQPGEAAVAFGNAWSEAVRDPGWWIQVITSTSGAMGGGRAPAPVPGRTPPPTLTSIPGGRPGPIPMRVGPGGRPIVASTPRPAPLSGPVARLGGPGGAAVAPVLEPAPVPAPVPAPALVPAPSPAPAAPAPRMPFGPGGGAVGVVGGSVIRSSGSTPAPSATSAPAPIIAIGNAPNERRNSNQTCTNNVLDGLQAQKDRICNSIPSQPDWSPSRSEKMLNRIPCSQIRPRLDAFRECARIRQEIQDRCFGGTPDAVHQRALDELLRSIANGEARLRINCAPGHPMASL